jgi:hypothetical protein
MAKFHFKARARGLRVTRLCGTSDIVFHNHTHQTDSEKDAELLRATKGVVEITEAPDKEPIPDPVGADHEPEDEGVPENKPAKRGRGKRGGKR